MKVLRSFIAAAALLFCSPALAEEPPRRIVSINVCADQYLLALADPSQILALSPSARDVTVSYFADKAAPFPLVSRHLVDDAESVLVLKPDLVLASIYNQPDTLARLRRLGIPVVAMEEASTLPGIRAQIEWLGQRLHQADRAARLTAEFDRTVAETAGHWRAAGKTALYYEHGGFTAGAASFIQALVAHVGLADAAGRAGFNAGGFVPLETVAAANPDFLIVPGNAAAPDEGSALLGHPALARLFPSSRRIVLPANESVCPGPAAMAALRSLTTPPR